MRIDAGWGGRMIENRVDVHVCGRGGERSAALILEAGRVDSGVGCNCGLIKVNSPFEMGRYEYDIKYWSLRQSSRVVFQFCLRHT